jgi:hypothetical protein
VLAARRNGGQPDLRDLFALKVEENRADQAVPHSSRTPIRPTSKDFFSFFQKVVDLHGIKSASLLRVPVECVNQASVLARMPKP